MRCVPLFLAKNTQTILDSFCLEQILSELSHATLPHPRWQFRQPSGNNASTFFPRVAMSPSSHAQQILKGGNCGGDFGLCQRGVGSLFILGPLGVFLSSLFPSLHFLPSDISSEINPSSLSLAPNIMNKMHKRALIKHFGKLQEMYKERGKMSAADPPTRKGQSYHLK